MFNNELTRQLTSSYFGKKRETGIQNVYGCFFSEGIETGALFVVIYFEVGSYKVHIYSRSVPYHNHRSTQPQFREIESRSALLICDHGRE